MHDYFLYVGLPYIAIFSLIVVSIYRLRSRQFGVSSLSSQFLEKESLLWGSVAWHIGIGIVLIGHLVAFIMPKFLQILVSNTCILYTLEAIGLICALFSFVGLIILFIRRLRNPRIQAVTTPVDLIIVVLLTLQVLLGILTAILYRWGLAWSCSTVTPYIQSVFTFKPDISYIQGMPFIVKLHISLAWLIILLFPFSRLLHFMATPLDYIFRMPQIVVWNFRRQKETVLLAEKEAQSRRHFLKATLGISAGLILLLIGVADKIVPFFRGSDLTTEEKEDILKKKLQKMKATIKQKELETERLTNEFIFIADLKDLKSNEGMYFIDYQMKPALAFRGDDGLPVLYSAKCPHLGCTIINKVQNGKLLCPCHISHFDLKTGDVIDGPAPKALSKIKYVLMDTNNELVVNINKTKLNDYKVYLVKKDNA